MPNMVRSLARNGLTRKPFEPDYFQTFYTMCDILVDTYARLLLCLEPPIGMPVLTGAAETVMRIDAKLKVRAAAPRP